MKMRSLYLIVPAVIATAGFLLMEKAASNPAVALAPATTETVATTATTPAVALAAPLTPAARAAKLGFARYLPADTGAVIAVHDGSKIAERVAEVKLFKLISEEMGGGLFGGPQGMPPDMEMDAPNDEDFAIPDEEEPGIGRDAKDGEVLNLAATGATLPVTADGPDPGSEEDLSASARRAALAAADADEEIDEDIPVIDPPSAGDMLGQEVTVAVGKSAGPQLANVLTAYERFYYFMLRAATRSFAAAAKTGDMESMSSAMASAMSEELAKDLLNDPQSGLSLLDRSKAPPIYVAFRTTPEKQEAVANQIAEFIDMMGSEGEVSEPVTIEQAGAKLTGFKLLGSKVAEEMASEREREDMEDALGAELTDKLLATVAKKNLVVASGTLGSYVVVFIGSAETDFALVTDPAQSLLAGPALAFADSYLAKELAVVVYGDMAASKALFEGGGGLANYAHAIRDGLNGSEGLGETRDLEAMLQMVGERETALRKLGSVDATGAIAFFDQGLRIETFGGYDPGAIDWKAPCRLSQMGDSPDVLMFANATSEAAYDEKAIAYYEAIVETAYAAMTKFSNLDIDDPDFGEFKGYLDIFNKDFRVEALTLWDALRGDFSAGLGKESALVMDCGGAMPTFPGLPQVVVDNAKFPRMTMIMPVTDRSKLKSSWVKINDAVTRMMPKIGEMIGEEVPMQKPMSSEKNGYTTWFMSLPFQSDDFVPSVTVGDKWFAAATSKNRALELLAKAEVADGTRTGMWFSMNFNKLRTYGEETVKMIEDNSATIFKDNESALEEFTSSKEMRDKMFEAMAELDSLTVHARRENGQMRSSVHFKTR